MRLPRLLSPFVLAGTSTLFILSGCGSGPSKEDQARQAQLASDLVSCKNELSTLKEQLAEAKAALTKAQTELSSATTKQLDPIDVKANPNTGEKHMEGNINPEAVVKVVRQNSGAFRACYEKALKRKPDLQYVSAVKARFQIRNTGTAFGVTFAPRTDSEMEGCMAGAMEKWKFPAFQGDPVAFEQPVNLVAR
jgi:hypothetical protein